MHGWRVFVGEVGIILLGVLLALGAQQLVEEYQERNDVSELRTAVRAELGELRARWEEMQKQDVCSLKRLDALDHWIANAPRGSELSSPYELVLRNINSSAWDIAKTSPVAADIPLKERLLYARFYGSMENWRAILASERANSDDLNGLLTAANDPQYRSEARVAVTKARAMIRRRQRNYPYFFSLLDELRIKPDRRGLDLLQYDQSTMCKTLKVGR